MLHGFSGLVGVHTRLSLIISNELEGFAYLLFSSMVGITVASTFITAERNSVRKAAIFATCVVLVVQAYPLLALLRGKGPIWLSLIHI